MITNRKIIDKWIREGRTEQLEKHGIPYTNKPSTPQPESETNAQPKPKKEITDDTYVKTNFSIKYGLLKKAKDEFGFKKFSSTICDLIERRLKELDKMKGGNR